MEYEYGLAQSIEETVVSVPERLRLLLRESEKDLRRILPQTSAEMGEKLYANSEGHRRSQVISTPPEDEVCV